MIEIYLATLLFGLGTMYNNSKNKKEIPTPANNANNPYKPNIIKNIKDEENELAEKLDTECKNMLPRSFSNLLDPNKTTNETILEYKPKSNNKIKSSLTGSEIPLDQFITSKTIGRENYNDVSSNTWAVPHFRGKATQNMNEEGFQNKLDIYTGTSEFNFHKKETNNFFKPSKDISFVNGVPNVLDKIEDRYIKSKQRNTELPFEQIKVAPGIGQNYSGDGKGAFHQFEINDLVKPKTIDELRTVNNQQKSYSEPVQAGKHIDKRSEQGKISKYTPDTFYLNTTSRWNKTPGANLKGKMKQNYIMSPTNRTSSRQVVGHASPTTNKKPTSHAKVKPSTNQRLGSFSKGHATQPNSWQIKLGSKKEDFQSEINEDNDDGEFDVSSYGKSGINLPPNERDTTQNKTIITNVVEAVKAIISPLQDKMKRTKKQNIEGNPNINGYLSPRMPEKITVNDPNDIAKTTIKETTEINNHQGNIEGHIKTTVYDPNDVARTTIKETTEINNMETQIKGATKLTVYDPNDVARTTLKETLIHDVRTGNIQLERNKKQMDYAFANAKKTMKETTIDNIHHTNVSYNRGDGKGYLSANYFAPSTLKQLTSNKQYSGNLSSSINNKGGYTSNKYFAPSTLKQLTSNNEYTGSANSYMKNSTNYDSMKNARTNPNREQLSKGRKPTQNSVKIFTGKYSQGNVGYNKQNSNYNGGKYSNISVRNGGNVTNNRSNITKPRVSLSNKSQRDLYNPNTLNQLNKNPFALSINRNQNNFEGFVSDTDLEDNESI